VNDVPRIDDSKHCSRSPGRRANWRVWASILFVAFLIFIGQFLVLDTDGVFLGAILLVLLFLFALERFGYLGPWGRLKRSNKAQFIVGLFLLGMIVSFSLGFWETFFCVLGGLLLFLLYCLVMACTEASHKFRDRERYKRQSTFQESADELLRRDTRAPVLLLRSFQDDVDLDGVDWRKIKAGVSFQPGLESDIKPILSDTGPVIAVARPGERFPPIGVPRLYLDDGWESDVRKLVRVSKLIALIVGTTPGLVREVRAILEIGCIEKLLLIFPREIPFLVNRRWRSFRDACDSCLREKDMELPTNLEETAMFAYFPDSFEMKVVHTEDVNKRDFASALYRVLTQLKQVKTPALVAGTEDIANLLLPILDKSKRIRKSRESENKAGHIQILRH